MITAYLTIDDLPTNNTKQVIDFLESKKIKPIMFCWGQHLEQHEESAIYALKHGAILQNHSYTHPWFSKLTLEHAKEEIEKTEELLNVIYKKAGVKRPYKLFRFPYCDQGGENRGKIQQFLKEKGFNHIDDTNIKDQDYVNFHNFGDQKNNLDVIWTFDFQEYQIRPDSSFTFEDSQKLVADFFPAQKEIPQDGSAPEGTKAEHIILIHDHEETSAMVENYFQDLINDVLSRGVRFAPVIVQ